MQLVLNVKNVVLGAALITAGYYTYRTFYADIQTEDIGKLIRMHRESQPARQLVIKRRILGLYNSKRDYGDLCLALDGPSPISEAFAVEIIREKGERQAIPRLLERLGDPGRAAIVKEELARTVGAFKVADAIPRLIELTDTHEAQHVRSAAHSALKDLTGAGGEMKLSEATRQHWTLMCRDYRSSSVR